MSVEESSPATAQVDAVEELLRQLVDARFVLTDRDGAVTRWSRPAEELFGWPSARMLGRPLVETLALSGDLPEFGGVTQTIVRRKDGTELELKLTFVPVGMSQSLEFNGFLEALEIAAPRGDALRRLQQSHRTVVDWVHAAMRGEAHLEEDDLAAGTIVAFRPLVELPPAPPAPTEEELETERVTTAAAGQIADAVEAALGRSDALERALQGTTTDLQEARDEALTARGEITEAAGKITALGSELADTRRVLEEIRSQAEDERERTRAAVAETRELAERLERELAGTPQAQEHLSAQLEETREALAELRATREKVDALEGELTKERGAGEERRRLEGELRETRTRVDQLEAALAETRERAGDADALDAALGELRGRVETLAGELASARETSDDGELDELRRRLAELESGSAQGPEELRERLATAVARLDQLERGVAGAAQGTELSAACSRATATSAATCSSRSAAAFTR
ncbi:MAG: two-component system, cell cycle sensor histidine kinase and response regulator CckA, partial [Thermoleophilaceae bacterium]|nr:two-component system, cell cycle sensor histidine kinase and response regulator CckA [Thermoleophilaceae bacterium]